MRTSRALPLLALPAAAALVLSGCSSSHDAAGADDGGAISVVASTNVYGDIARTVGGDAVDVTSIISDPSQDPHSYEADARTQLAVSKADVVIENGGGYDAFVDTMLSAGDSSAAVVTAVDVSGLDPDAEGDAHSDDEHADESTGSADAETDEHDHDHGAFNEHVFYSLPSMAALADEIAHRLGEVDPAQADAFTANAAAFGERITDLEAQVEQIHQAHDGQSVAYTEPVPGYLFDDMGLVNVTPASFSEAIEEGDDVSPAVLNETLKLFTDGRVDLLAYNEQTSSPETEAVESAASDAGVAIVPVTELLPEGDDYISWQQSNIDAISAALEK
ncbi:metal ABC transporter solute-binding protein, Zn/Mn family [Frigoribacterium faeni]|uniref:Metal ABC transporter substrate-binding protein n=1 Tax=Frigoribacterium faeni TaxID=145483 RepID=A0A7W3JKE5_9MICO|nr:zinc ABC transporter substrate-binding protein [Frigoribacterium faeni]MBA8814463.1 zinc/manganese transport system substrate-binding protein [Frigoribacterium faeni]GEK84098.1 metal ABC transporter substrate-binding protein [Frigoribacterium faeni]